MLEIVLFMASKVVGGTSFWMRVTSNGSTSCIILASTDFYKNKQSSVKSKIYHMIILLKHINEIISEYIYVLKAHNNSE